MKLHEIIESDGKKRKIVGFDSEGRPITELYDGETSDTEEEAPAEEPKEEEEAKESTETEEFKCQYCGKVCKSDLGLKAHEKACKDNPNK